jgi:hypothetical protein
MHILFLVVQVTHANPAKHQRLAQKLIPNFHGSQYESNSLMDVG